MAQQKIPCFDLHFAIIVFERVVITFGGLKQVRITVLKTTLIVSAVLLITNRSVERLKFITDGMLGKLTRWLRMLGHDVEYSKSDDDKILVKKAKTEKRVLLTRDLGLFQQALTQGIEAALVESATGPEKLARLAEQFNFELKIDVTVSRCPKCNAKIKSVSKDMVIGKVPETTSTYYNAFWKCPKCRQIYWQGAHWKRIEKTLKEAKKALKTL